MLTPSKIPSAETDYKSPEGMLLDPETWDGVFASLGERIRALEAKRIELQAVIDLLKTQALGVISESVSAEIVVQRARLDGFAEALQALKDQYDEYQAGGIYADGIRLRGMIAGLGSIDDVQEALVAILAKFNSQRRITVASVYFGSL